MENQTISVWPEAAKALGIKSKDAAYKAAHAGEIPVIKIGKLLRVPKAAFQHYLTTGENMFKKS